ncbi:MAG: hypothetical protein ACK5QX_09715 [bacterium]
MTLSAGAGWAAARPARRRPQRCARCARAASAVRNACSFPASRDPGGIVCPMPIVACTPSCFSLSDYA